MISQRTLVLVELSVGVACQGWDMLRSVLRIFVVFQGGDQVRHFGSRGRARRRVQCEILRGNWAQRTWVWPYDHGARSVLTVRCLPSNSAGDFASDINPDVLKEHLGPLLPTLLQRTGDMNSRICGAASDVFLFLAAQPQVGVSFVSEFCTAPIENMNAFKQVIARLNLILALITEYNFGHADSGLSPEVCGVGGSPRRGCSRRSSEVGSDETPQTLPIPCMYPQTLPPFCRPTKPPPSLPSGVGAPLRGANFRRE